MSDLTLVYYASSQNPKTVVAFFEKGEEKFYVELPLFMIDMMLQDRECSDIFLKKEFVVDSEFDEEFSSEKITNQIKENINDFLFFGDTHNIDGIGRSKYDLFRINSCYLSNLK